MPTGDHQRTTRRSSMSKGPRRTWTPTASISTTSSTEDSVSSSDPSIETSLSDSEISEDELFTPSSESTMTSPISSSSCSSVNGDDDPKDVFDETDVSSKAKPQGSSAVNTDMADDRDNGLFVQFGDVQLPADQLSPAFLEEHQACCSSCLRRIMHRNLANVYLHPTLRVLVCRRCNMKLRRSLPGIVSYNIRKRSQPLHARTSQKSTLCHWSLCRGDSSSLFRCSRSPCGLCICRRCFKTHLSGAQFKTLVTEYQRGSWICPRCQPGSILQPMQLYAAMVSEYARLRDKPIAVVLPSVPAKDNDTHESVRYQLMLSARALVEDLAFAGWKSDVTPPNALFKRLEKHMTLSQEFAEMVRSHQEVLDRENIVKRLVEKFRVNNEHGIRELLELTGWNLDEAENTIRASSEGRRLVTSLATELRCEESQVTALLDQTGWDFREVRRRVKLCIGNNRPDQRETNEDSRNLKRRIRRVRHTAVQVNIDKTVPNRMGAKEANRVAAEITNGNQRQLDEGSSEEIETQGTITSMNGVHTIWCICQAKRLTQSLDENSGTLRQTARKSDPTSTLPVSVGASNVNVGPLLGSLPIPMNDHPRSLHRITGGKKSKSFSIQPSLQNCLRRAQFINGQERPGSSRSQIIDRGTFCENRGTVQRYVSQPPEASKLNIVIVPYDEDTSDPERLEIVDSEWELSDDKEKSSMGKDSHLDIPMEQSPLLEANPTSHPVTEENHCARTCVYQRKLDTGNHSAESGKNGDKRPLLDFNVRPQELESDQRPPETNAVTNDQTREGLRLILSEAEDSDVKSKKRRQHRDE